MTDAPSSLTPPMQPGPLGPTRASSWPSVVGIICIVFGVLGILFGLWGLVSPIVMRSVMAGAAATPGGAAALKMQGLAQISSACALVLAMLLIAGGVATNAHRAAGPRLLLIWSALRIILALVMTLVMAPMMMAQGAAVSAQTRGAPAGMMAGMMVFSLVFSMIWYCALPVFLLIWLRLRSSRRLIAEWS